MYLYCLAFLHVYFLIHLHFTINISYQSSFFSVPFTKLPYLRSTPPSKIYIVTDTLVGLKYWNLFMQFPSASFPTRFCPSYKEEDSHKAYMYSTNRSQKDVDLDVSSVYFVSDSSITYLQLATKFAIWSKWCQSKIYEMVSWRKTMMYFFALHSFRDSLLVRPCSWTFLPDFYCENLLFIWQGSGQNSFFISKLFWYLTWGFKIRIILSIQALWYWIHQYVK